MPNYFVTEIDLAKAPQLRAALIEQGFTLHQPTHTLFQGKKSGVTCTLYASGKLMVQGKAMKEFIEFYLEPELLGTFTFTHPEKADPDERIGVDESGKGDFFGPLCIAGVYVKKGEAQALAELGVKDSKRLKDDQILKIAQKIKKHYLYHVVRIGPEKYNELYARFRNLNTLLGWGHAKVIEALLEKTDCPKVIIDQFAAPHVVENALKHSKKQTELIQRTKGEEDLVVAAASILAREQFVQSLKALEERFEMKLPKGASKMTIEAGRAFVQRFGKESLPLVGKMHFKTASELS